jgi:hypothetical protein
MGNEAQCLRRVQLEMHVINEKRAIQKLILTPDMVVVGGVKQNYRRIWVWWCWWDKTKLQVA